MRRTLTGIALAVYLATVSVTILAHGLAGAGPIFTAVYVAASTLLLAACGRWREIRLDSADLAFIAFVVCAGLSLAISGFADPREVVLLGFSVVAYPAARGMVEFLPGRALIAFLGALLIAGSVATAVALATQWSALHGKPLVFGEFDHAPAQFALLLGVIAITAACSDLSLVPILALLAVPAAIFAASQTRLTFLAILLSLFAMAALAPGARRRAGAIAAVLLACVLAGGIARGHVTARFVQYAADSLSPTPSAAATEVTDAPDLEPALAQGCAPIDPNNSIAIRKQLFADAFALLPAAGLFGIGLDRFAARSCLAGDYPHNSILQAALELGIPAGLALAALIIIVGRSLLAHAGTSGEARLALGMLAFVLLLAMAHGRISHDGIVFVALGYGAAVASRRARDATR
jgi:hypothetical protein